MEIPPAKDTDAEDVVWGLQTAETLWKRGERIDALVWLRRAAQAAGDANDDDRALELARHAAELTEWMANASDEEAGEPIDVEGAEHVDQTISTAPPTPWDAAVPAPPAPWDVAPSQSPLQRARASVPPPEEVEPFPAPVAPPPRPPPRPVATGSSTNEHTPQNAEDEGRPSATSVPPAEKVHAGMFDPWADQSAQNIRAAEPKTPPPPPPLPVRVPVVASSSSPPLEAEEEVITSVRPHALAAQQQQQQPSTRPESAPPVIPAAPITAPLPNVVPPPRPSRPSVQSMRAAGAPPPVPGKPPPLPPRRPQTAPSPPKPLSVPAAPPSAPPAPVSVAPEPDVAMPDIEPYVPPPSELGTIPPAEVAAVTASALPPPATAVISEPPKAASEAPPPEAPPPPSPEAAKRLDLDNVEAFSDLPDDAREAFAAAATIHTLNEGEEIGSFALAYVISGSFDVAATVVDAPAVRLNDGAVLRSRGTTDENVPIRMICAKGQSLVATWSDAAVDEAFRTIPWVEEDLRAAADRVQTLVGITIGPLGERLDPSIRETIMAKLTMRPLIAKEIIVHAGEPVPGLLLVGIGELELVKDDKVTGIVGSGEFLFPTEVLGAGSAPTTARAGPGGALVMFGDRRIAQELLVTCPPLLEVFAGM